MVYKDVKDLDARLYTLRSSRQIVAPDHELVFTSWDDYSKTIRAIEQATGSVTEALEATVVYLTIIAYSENENDKNRDLELMQSNLVRQFVMFYSALADIDMSSLLVASTRKRPLSFPDSTVIVGDKRNSDSLYILYAKGDIYDNYTSYLYDILNYISYLPKSWNLPTKAECRSTINSHLANMIISRFFNKELYDKVIHDRLNITGIAFFENTAAYRYKSYWKHGDFEPDKLTTLYGKSGLSIITKQKLLGCSIIEAEAAYVSLGNFKSKSLDNGKLQPLGRAKLCLEPSKCTIAITDQTKILTHTTTI